MVKYLFCLLFLFGCAWFKTGQLFDLHSNNQDHSTDSSSCSRECQQDCRTIFSNADELDQCTRLSDSTVRQVERAVNNMSRGLWKPITEDQISHISNISYSPWLKYADGSTESAENMLIWLAENEEIPYYLDEEGEILKTVLASLSSFSFDRGVKDALSKDIEEGKTFLEMTAWNKNDEGFRRIHKVILETCENNEICIRQTYCQNNSDIVPDTVNKMELNLDFQNFDFACP